MHWGQDCVTSYPYYPRWTTDRQARAWLCYTHAQVCTENTHIHTHARAHAHTPQCYQYTGMLVAKKAEHGLKTFTQHATSNPKQTRELDGGGGGERKNGLPGYLWKRRVEVLSVLLQSDGGGGGEEKKSRQPHREALTDQLWLKDTWKGFSQNTALPSWTFYSAASCSWYKRQRKRNTPVNSCLSLDSWEQWNIRLPVTALLSSQKGLTFTIWARSLFWRWSHTISGTVHWWEHYRRNPTWVWSSVSTPKPKVANLYFHKIKTV